MDPDTVFVIGLVLAAFSIPAGVSAYSESRRPVSGMVSLVVSGCMMVYASRLRPGGYALADIPEVFFGVVARMIP
ncbi:hypothetical protein [Ruegeria marina]|uniref:50S ribosomal protein L35 n=1 Tax=Ruegeria marina TaxID=639004 RepID=A0A1G6ZWU1_9RHOB|nr:hypothetical protein [Ruegeria marina]SDE06315.1 hypothetical protein SAMN04488239_113107 [Ruegeria marina]